MESETEKDDNTFIYVGLGGFLLIALCIIVGIVMQYSMYNSTPPTPVDAFTFTTDKSAYQPGETAHGSLTVNGEVRVVNLSVDFQAQQGPLYFTVKHFVYSGSKAITLDLPIPAEYNGISTKGNYKLVGEVYADDEYVGSFEKSISIY